MKVEGRGRPSPSRTPSPRDPPRRGRTSRRARPTDRSFRAGSRRGVSIRPIMRSDNQLVSIPGTRPPVPTVSGTRGRCIIDALVAASGHHHRLRTFSCALTGTITCGPSIACNPDANRYRSLPRLLAWRAGCARCSPRCAQAAAVAAADARTDPLPEVHRAGRDGARAGRDRARRRPGRPRQHLLLRLREQPRHPRSPRHGAGRKHPVHPRSGSCTRSRSTSCARYA